jgi:uncharacterized membrane protein
MKQKTLKQRMQKIKKSLALKKSFPIILIVFGLVGLLASAVINIEKSHLLRNPNSELGCNLNPVYSCGSVIMTKQSEILGFSNELMGMAMFAAIVTVGVVLLAGGELKAWFWRLFVMGMVGSMVFVGWFFYQSVYVINALCIFCSLVWFSTWAITVAVATWSYDRGYLPKIPKAAKEYVQRTRQNIGYVWLGGIVLAAILILHHFWYFYGQYFGY